MLKVTFKGKVYEYDVKEQMEALTGTESIMVEDYLGGWSKFRAPANMTRSAVVMVWFALKAAGEPKTFEEISDTKGFPFQDDAFTADDTDTLDGQSPPEPTPLTTTAPKPDSPAGEPKPALKSLSGNG
jgi:hypothetical protein